jgi:chemotaxis protein MotA
MDLASAIGLPGGIIAMIGAIMLEEKGIVGHGYFNIPGAVIIFLGTSLATMTAFTVEQLKTVPTLVRMTFFNQPEDFEGVIRSMITFAQKARREGLLALEADIEEIEDPFFKKGLQLVVDGVDPELIRAILETEMDATAARHKVGEEIFMAAGGFAPTMGILGAIMGLTGALGKMGAGDIMTTVHALAIAFIASFYGVAVANLVFIPIAGKLKMLSHEELFLKEIIVSGILSIQAGDNPRIVEERLKAYFSAKKYPLKGEGEGQ